MLQAPTTEAPEVPSIAHGMNAVVAAALALMGEHAVRARAQIGVDDAAARVAIAAIGRGAAGALADVRRLLDTLPAAHPSRRALADDLHDTLGHGVSLASVLAGAACARLDSDPAWAAETLDRIAAVADETGSELRGLLSAEGASSADAARSRRARATDVAALADCAAAGQPVACRVDDDALAAAPARVASAAHRIVQESLTNARRHAPGAAVVVHVGLQGDALIAVVANGPGRASRASGTRRGISGMRRRAHAIGGELRAGPTPAGGFRVHARLPLGH